MSGFIYEKDSDGIVTITMDMDGPVNTMNGVYRQLMADTVEKLEQEEGLKGLVITSAKDTFFAGGDLKELLTFMPGDEDIFFTMLEASKAHLRRLERLEVPVVAAINGAALGGGFEICLVCNHRIVVNDRKAVVGLPEVTLGLLPGGGGVVRMIQLLGLEKALPYLLEGIQVKPSKALADGLINEMVNTQEELVPRAKQWIKENPDAWQQPWDVKGFKVPGGSANAPRVRQIIEAAPAVLRKKTRSLLPAPERILSIAAEATLVDIDTALRIESRGMTYLVTTPQAKNIITTMFFQMKQVNGGFSRPKGIEPSKVKKLGVLGAGMMGQGIAYVSAKAGIEVILKDISIESAEKGKAYSEKLLNRQIDKGRINQTQKDAFLHLITPTDNDEDLAGCDFIIEAVFEDIDLKASVTKEAEGKLIEGGVFGSNTSTLPITLLAEASEKPENFIGVHFFSPVDRMPLIEIICGDKTSDEVLAKTFDYVQQIGKTPIVVNDILGFFTSRVFSTFIDEGARLLKEGVDPVVIDNLGKQIGMPVGPLAVHDEVSQELWRKAAATQRSLGVFSTRGDNSVGTELAEMMIHDYGRGGRYHGGGYYEYPEGGGKHIWPKLYEIFHMSAKSLLEQDIKDRLLFRQVIESIKCLQEGVLRTVADGNVGSILGIGAPLWTGGFLQFVNTYGLGAFVGRTTELAKQYGDRFDAPALLLEMVEKNDKFN